MKQKQLLFKKYWYNSDTQFEPERPLEPEIPLIPIDPDNPNIYEGTLGEDYTFEIETYPTNKFQCNIFGGFKVYKDKDEKRVEFYKLKHDDFEVYNFDALIDYGDGIIEHVTVKNKKEFYLRDESIIIEQNNEPVYDIGNGQTPLKFHVYNYKDELYEKRIIKVKILNGELYTHNNSTFNSAYITRLSKDDIYINPHINFFSININSGKYSDLLHIKNYNIKGINNICHNYIESSKYYRYDRNDNIIYTNINICDNINIIGNFSFSNFNIDKLNISDNIDKIGIGAFQRVFLKNKTIILPKNIEIIDDIAFSGTEIEYIILPDNINNIGDETFSSCKLNYIKFNNNIKYIGKRTFTDNFIIDDYETGNIINSVIIIPEGLEIFNTDSFNNYFNSFKLYISENTNIITDDRLNYEIIPYKLGEKPWLEDEDYINYKNKLKELFDIDIND